MNEYYGYVESPIGLIEIGGTATAVTSLRFAETRHETFESNAVVEEARHQVEEYFAGTRRDFTLDLAPAGTEFQQRVWRALHEVPYGHLASYQEIAVAIGRPDAVRAVGAANGNNPIAIIAPCHRIIGSNGDLTGYGGGLWRKEWLLKHEGSLLC